MDRRINNNNGQRRERRTLFRPAAACPDPHALLLSPDHPPGPLAFIKRIGRTGPLQLATGHWLAGLAGLPMAGPSAPSLAPLASPVPISGRIAILSGTPVVSRRVKSRRVAIANMPCQGRLRLKSAFKTYFSRS